MMIRNMGWTTIRMKINLGFHSSSTVSSHSPVPPCTRKPSKTHFMWRINVMANIQELPFYFWLEYRSRAPSPLLCLIPSLCPCLCPFLCIGPCHCLCDLSLYQEPPVLVFVLVLVLVLVFALFLVLFFYLVYVPLFVLVFFNVLFIGFVSFTFVQRSKCSPFYLRPEPLGAPLLHLPAFFSSLPTVLSLPRPRAFH